MAAGSGGATVGQQRGGGARREGGVMDRGAGGGGGEMAGQWGIFSYRSLWQAFEPHVDAPKSMLYGPG